MTKHTKVNEEEYVQEMERFWGGKAMEAERMYENIVQTPTSEEVFGGAFKEESKRLEVAAALKELRKLEGLTQRQLAEKVNKPQSTIARIENGSINVTFKTMKEIANALGKDIEVRFV